MHTGPIHRNTSEQEDSEANEKSERNSSRGGPELKRGANFGRLSENRNDLGQRKGK